MSIPRHPEEASTAWCPVCSAESFVEEVRAPKYDEYDFFTRCIVCQAWIGEAPDYSFERECAEDGEDEDAIKKELHEHLERLKPYFDNAALLTECIVCPTCAAPIGSRCTRRGTAVFKPMEYHARRIDKALAALRRSRTYWDFIQDLEEHVEPIEVLEALRKTPIYKLALAAGVKEPALPGHPEEKPMANKIFANRCTHLASHEIKHGYTLEVRTAEGLDADFRYGTGPDQIELCLLCSGRLMAFLSSKELLGGSPKPS